MQFLSYSHSIMWKSRQWSLASDTPKCCDRWGKGSNEIFKWPGPLCCCSRGLITPGETWSAGGQCTGEAAAILWSAGNGSGTASASATVTASSCAECLVGDGNLPSALHAVLPAGRGKGCWSQGVCAWRWAVPPACCAGKPLKSGNSSMDRLSLICF